MTSAVYDFKAIKSQVKDGDWWKPAKDGVVAVPAAQVAVDDTWHHCLVTIEHDDGSYTIPGAQWTVLQARDDVGEVPLGYFTPAPKP